MHGAMVCELAATLGGPQTFRPRMSECGSHSALHRRVAQREDPSKRKARSITVEACCVKFADATAE